LKNILLITLVSLSILLSGCGGSSDDAASPSVKAVNTLDQNMTEAYQMYVEKTLSNRVVSFKLFEDVVDKETLSGTDLDEIHKMLARYLDNKFETALRIDEYQYLVSQSDDDYTQKERYELVMMSLSAMLIRYDNYLLAYSKYDEDSKLNDILNDEDSAYDIPALTLEDDILYLYELDTDRDDISDMISYYKANKSKYENDTNSYYLYLKTLVEDSPSYQIGFEESFFLFDLFDSIYDAIADSAGDLFSSFFNTVSENIGNTAGLVETREGYLYNDEQVAIIVRDNLLPGDILVERTPFRLTDKLIPGYWGHIAVYIGSQNDLEEMGIWDDLNVTYNPDTNRTYQDDVIDDKLIVEALRDGVQLNSVEHFLNVDDLAILHDANETLESRTLRIKRVIAQLGKEYDFEYDIEDNSKIVCSELVYITSLDIEWDTGSTIGINTISPDNVAIVSTQENTVLSIPLIYHEGEFVTTDPSYAKEYMTTILDEYEE